MSDITGIQKPFLARISEYSDIVLAITVVAILGILVLPLPPMLLDFLLASPACF
jgi:type III secretory pathway component EscV